MRQILTDAACKTRAPRAGRLEIADLRQAGLVLRITANGARSFAYRFRHPANRKTLRATIGTYPATSLEAARKRAQEMASQVEAGTNPIDTKRSGARKGPYPHIPSACRPLPQRARRAAQAPPLSRRGPTQFARSHLAQMGQARFSQPSRRADVIELIESIVSAGKHAAGNRVHSLISRRFFRLPSMPNLLDANPAAAAEKARCRKCRPPCPRRRRRSGCSGAASF